MNAYGLTYIRWFAAATFGVPVANRAAFATYRKAWWNGEDPTEWAAAGQKAPLK